MRPLQNDEPASSSIYLRVTPKEKAAYVRAANGKKLSEWIKGVLNESAKTTGANCTSNPPA